MSNSKTSGRIQSRRAGLRGIDIEAQPGETVAIVGPTGAGKTTIINLLPDSGMSVRAK